MIGAEAELCELGLVAVEPLGALGGGGREICPARHGEREEWCERGETVSGGGGDGTAACDASTACAFEPPKPNELSPATSRSPVQAESVFGTSRFSAASGMSGEALRK